LCSGMQWSFAGVSVHRIDILKQTAQPAHA
jgi:hypothetical protein